MINWCVQTGRCAQMGVLLTASFSKSVGGQVWWRTSWPSRILCLRATCIKYVFLAAEAYAERGVNLSCKR